MENVLKGNENCFELTGGSSYKGFELQGADCISFLLFSLHKEWCSDVR